MDEVEVVRLIGEARAALDRIETGSGSLVELEAAPLGERHNPGAVVIGD